MNKEIEIAALEYASQAYGKPLKTPDLKKQAHFTDGADFVIAKLLPREVAHWKSIAFQLANDLDDIYLFVKQFKEDNRVGSPLFDLILKKKIACDKHIVIRKGQVMEREEWEAREKESRHQMERLTSMLQKGL